MAVLLVNEIAKLLKCNVSTIRFHLDHPEDRNKVIRHFSGALLQTTYLNRKKEKTRIRFAGITENGAYNIKAYGKLKMLYNCSIVQHYFARHRIRLRDPYLQCVVTHTHHNTEFYPIELLEIVSNPWNELPDLKIANDTEPKCNVLLRVCPHCKDLCEMHCPDESDSDKFKEMGKNMFLERW
jgi:hypothetical protein